MFIDIRNLQERRQERDSQFEGTRDIRNGYLFEVNGSIEGDREGLVWFRARDGNSEPFQVFYNGVIGDIRANMFVKIERNPKDPARWQVIEFDTGIYFDDQSAYEQLPSLSMIPNKEDYEWPPGFPGAKALNIFPRQITDFAIRPTSPISMKARVYSGIYPGATNYARFQGPVNTKDFTADIPGAGLALLAAISIDNTGTLNYTNGSTFVDGLPMPDASLPAVPASQMLISAIRLVNGMTAIEESNFDLEMRPLMANGTVNVKVSEIWESDFGAVALETDASGNVTINGTRTLTIPTDLIHAGDADTKLSFADDKISLTAGDLLMFEATEIAGQDTLDLGDVAGGGDVDINFNSDQMFLQGSSGNLHIGGADPDSPLVVAGETFVGPPAASGNTSNSEITIGLTLNQEANDDHIFELKSSDIAHGMTDLTETDTYFYIRKSVSTTGGATMFGLGENNIGFLNFGVAVNDTTTKSTASAGYIEFRAAKKSGTGITDAGADANLVVFRNNATARFIFDAEGTGHADDSWITFSDRRLKTEIENIPYGLKELMLLRPKRFVKQSGALDGDGGVELLGKGRRKIGLIAQDVKSIIPEAVKGIDSEATSFYSLDYDSLSALLISAVQELKLEVDELRHTYGII